MALSFIRLLCCVFVCSSFALVRVFGVWSASDMCINALERVRLFNKTRLKLKKKKLKRKESRIVSVFDEKQMMRKYNETKNTKNSNCKWNKNEIYAHLNGRHIQKDEQKVLSQLKFLFFYLDI